MPVDDRAELVQSTEIVVLLLAFVLVLPLVSEETITSTSTSTSGSTKATRVAGGGPLWER